MPVEIRELIIRANIGNPNQGEKNTTSEPQQGETPKEDIIAESVRQMMQLIKDKNER